MGSKQKQARWCVVCDDESWRFRTRREARAFAARLKRHPANVDVRRFGPYANADGRVYIVDSRRL